MSEDPTVRQMWVDIERLGREVKHVVARCPRCGSRCSVKRPATVKGEKAWPRCRCCSSFADRASAPRVEPDAELMRSILAAEFEAAR